MKQVSVSWSPPIDNGVTIDNYLIRWALNGSNQSAVQVAGTVFSTSLGNFNDGDTITGTIVAIGNGLESSQVTIPSITVVDPPATPPNPPQNVTSSQS